MTDIIQACFLNPICKSNPSAWIVILLFQDILKSNFLKMSFFHTRATKNTPGGFKALKSWPLEGGITEKMKQ